ncbi:uncharacterized [Tachysurus ichikawai]
MLVDWIIPEGHTPVSFSRLKRERDSSMSSGLRLQSQLGTGNPLQARLWRVPVLTAHPGGRPQGIMVRVTQPSPALGVRYYRYGAMTDSTPGLQAWE